LPNQNAIVVSGINWFQWAVNQTVGLLSLRLCGKELSFCANEKFHGSLSALNSEISNAGEHHGRQE
jgi:hypothetical protein